MAEPYTRNPSPAANLHPKTSYSGCATGPLDEDAAGDATFDCPMLPHVSVDRCHSVCTAGRCNAPPVALRYLPFSVDVDDKELDFFSFHASLQMGVCLDQCLE